MKAGHLYIASNRAIPGLLKIGETRWFDLRQKSLSTSNVPEDFRVLYFRYCDDVRQAEKRVFSSLSEFRVVSGKEFFRVTLKKARSLIDDICYDINSRNQHLMDTVVADDLSFALENEWVPVTRQELDIDEDE